MRANANLSQGFVILDNVEQPFAIDKRRARLAFERAARTYDQAAVLQREVCSRMLSRLDYIKYEPETILDAGSGTGYGARGLKARYSRSRVVELDIAFGMLLAGRARIPWWRRLAGGEPLSVCGDFESLPLATEAVDMVWSNLALQWCNDLPRAFSEARRVLKPEGLFMFSTFGPDTLKELRMAFGEADGYTHVSRFTDMHDIGDLLVQAGFADPVMDMEYITLTYDDVKSVMEDLKAIGAHNATAGRPRGLTGKSAWRRVLAAYEGLRRDGRLPATFEIVYGHAWKPKPRLAQEGKKIIPIQRKE